MTFEMVMKELESLGNQRTKKIYMSNGAREPLFGVNTGSMKPMSKIIKIDHDLAEKLYATGNYDAMYFAGIIADPNKLTKGDYNRWMDQAYFYMLSDFVVAVTLSESDIAFEVADEWIKSGEDLRMSAGWSCYCWLIGNRKDDEFDKDKISKMLDFIKDRIHDMSDRTKNAMNYFIYAVGLSYLPLHEKAIEIYKDIGVVKIMDKKKEKILNAHANIMRDVHKGRIGFKRKYVRC